MMQIIEDIERHWRELGISHGPPVSSEEISAFEARYGICFPAELRTYVMRLNGSQHGSGGPHDDRMFAFWHLDELRPVGEANSRSALPHVESLFVFADWSISAHEYAVRLDPNPALVAPVLVVHRDAIAEIAPSFTAFLEGSVRGDDEMLFPKPWGTK